MYPGGMNPMGGFMGSAVKTICISVGVLIVLGVLVGVIAGNAPFLNPGLAQARADRERAATNAMRAQQIAEAEQRALELEQQDELNERKLQAQEERQAIGQVFLKGLSIVALATLIAAMVVAFVWALVRIRDGQQDRAAERAELIASLPPPPVSDVQPQPTEPTPPAPLIRASRISSFRPSYDGALAFVHDFGLANGRGFVPARFTQADSERQYYPTGIDPEIARIYLWILDRRRVIFRHPNSSVWELHAKIGGLDDVVNRIPRPMFEALVEQDYSIDLVELDNVMQTEPLGSAN